MCIFPLLECCVYACPCNALNLDKKVVESTLSEAGEFFFFLTQNFIGSLANNSAPFSTGVQWRSNCVLCPTRLLGLLTINHKPWVRSVRWGWTVMNKWMRILFVFSLWGFRRLFNYVWRTSSQAPITSCFNKIKICARF